MCYNLYPTWTVHTSSKWRFCKKGRLLNQWAEQGQQKRKCVKRIATQPGNLTQSIHVNNDQPRSKKCSIWKLPRMVHLIKTSSVIQLFILPYITQHLKGTNWCKHCVPIKVRMIFLLLLEIIQTGIFFNKRLVTKGNRCLEILAEDMHIVLDNVRYHKGGLSKDIITGNTFSIRHLKSMF